MDLSIIKYYGMDANRCGYCKGTKTSKAHGMHAYTMSPQDYQALINRGWRRCGQYCYKPHNPTTCCPSYTIKCDALDFKLSKSHKKILKRMTRFLRDGKKESREENSANHKDNSGYANNSKNDADNECDIQDEPKAPDVPLPKVDLEVITAANRERNAIAKESNERYMNNLQVTTDSTLPDQPTTSQRAVKKPTLSNSSANPPCKKAKQMRIERRRAKLIEKGVTEILEKPKSTPTEKSLSDYIADTSPNDKHKLKIVLVSSGSLKVEMNVHALYRKYQLIVHNDSPDRVKPTNLERFLYKTPLQLKIISVNDKKEFSPTVMKTYALYQKYQTRIHNDPPEDIDDYLAFLVHSPLKYYKSHGGPPQGYGSFHQQYWLDENLIAVAVIDILPHCLSSVYFFYDPDYSFLSLGTYASLREIEFVQHLSKTAPALKYYYMGFYIHSCPKMRYKGKLVPSHLLCPETYTWHLLVDDIRTKLDEKKYQRLHPDENAKDLDEFKELDLDGVMLLSENQILTYKQYIQSFKIGTLDHMLDRIRSRIYKEITGDEDDRDVILEYGNLVGKPCAHKMLYMKV